MANFHTTVDIEAPPDRIWACLSDIERWPLWTPTVTSIRPLDHGPLTVGTRAIVSQPKLLPARWRITEVEEGRCFTWITRGPGVLITARHCVEGGARNSRVVLSLDFSGVLGPLAARLTRALNTRYLALEARGLKQYVEAQLRPEGSR